MNSKESQIVIFISHANVQVDPEVPVPQWSLSEKGRSRHERFNKNECVKNIISIYSSKERKSIEAAEILSENLNLNFDQMEELGEMDRSSTGYLAEEEFQHTANLFFENPTTSIRGWEKASDAQNRIVKAVQSVLKKEKRKGAIAIVSHGGVGALLLCSLLNKEISRDFDQPLNGGGNYFCFERETLKVIHSWEDIAKE